MKKNISIFLLTISLFFNCTKDKDDNTLNNLFLLYFLTAGKTESATLVNGASIRHNITLSAGKKFTYTVSQESSPNSSILTRSTDSEESSITAFLLDPDKKLVQGIKTVEGMSDEIIYTPETSGNYSVLLQSEGNARINVGISGGSANNSIASENSQSKLLEGTRKYGVSGLLLAESFLLADVFEVSSVGSDGTPTYQRITDAVVTMNAAGGTKTLTYNANHSLIGSITHNGYAYTLTQNEQNALKTNPVSLSVSHPTKSDLKIDLELETYPTYVSEVKINDNNTQIGSGSIELNTTSEVNFTWKNATTSKPDIIRIEVLSNRDRGFVNSYVYPKASDEKYTLKKEFLKYLTKSAETNNDNCIGIPGGAGASALYDKDFYAGVGMDGNIFRSGIMIANFNFTGFFPSYGWVCEQNTINSLNQATYSSANLPVLTVK